MNIKNIFSFLNKAKAVPTKRTNEQGMSFSPRGSYGLNEPFPMQRGEYLNNYNSWVYSACNAIAKECSQIELELHDETDEIIWDHPASILMQKVSSSTTFYDLMYITSLYLELTGEAYWWLVKGQNGEPMEIYPYIRPDFIEVIPSSDVREFIKGYIYTIPGTQKQVPFAKDEMIQFKYSNPMNPYRGFAPILGAAMPINTEKESSKWNWRFFYNNAIPRGILKIAAPFSEETFKQLETNWNAAHKGTDNNNKIAFLFGGKNNAIDFTELGMSQKDMDFLNLRKYSREEILSVMGVPMSVINPDNVVNRATVEATRVNFLDGTIKPKMTQRVAYLNEFLLPMFRNIEGWYFTYKDPSPQNVENDLKKYDSGLNHGWLTVNEVRQMEGLEPLEDIKEPKEEKPDNEMTEEEENIEDKKTYKQKKIESIVRRNLDKETKYLTEQVTKKLTENKVEMLDAEFEKKGLEFWEKKVLKTDIQEQKLEDQIIKEFNRQEKEVLNQLVTKGYKKKDALNGFDDENDIFAEIFGDEYNWLVATFGADALLNLGISKEFIMSEVVDTYIKTKSLEAAKSINNTTKDLIRKQLADGVQAGESIPQLSKRIKGVYSDATTKRAAIIARTEVSRASNYGTYQGYIQSGVVKQIRWWTAIDERVCDFCRPMHGKTFDLGTVIYEKDSTVTGELSEKEKLAGKTKTPTFVSSYESIMHPPLHISCRCVLLPV